MLSTLCVPQPSVATASFTSTALLQETKPLLMNISILPLCRALSTIRSIRALVVTLQVLCSTTPTRGPPAFRGDWRSPLRGSPSYAHRTITHSALSDEVMCRLAMAQLTRLLEFLVSHNISWDRLTELTVRLNRALVVSFLRAKAHESYARIEHRPPSSDRAWSSPSQCHGTRVLRSNRPAPNANGVHEEVASP